MCRVEATRYGRVRSASRLQLVARGGEVQRGGVGASAEAHQPVARGEIEAPVGGRPPAECVRQTSESATTDEMTAAVSWL